MSVRWRGILRALGFQIPETPAERIARVVARAKDSRQYRALTGGTDTRSSYVKAKRPGMSRASLPKGEIVR